MRFLQLSVLFNTVFFLAVLFVACVSAANSASQKPSSQQKFTNTSQLKLLLINVAKSERDLEIRNDPNSLPGDKCYEGMSDALSIQGKNDFVSAGLKELSSSIFQATIGLISTGNPHEDFLLKFGAKMLSATIQNKPLTEESILFVTKKTVGYVVSKSSQSSLLGKTTSLLYEDIYKKLTQEDLLAWKFSGSNLNSQAQKTNLAPFTQIKAEIFYSPYTHYTTAVIGATCKFANGEIKENIYVLSYKVIKTQYSGAEIVDGTLNVLLVPEGKKFLSVVPSSESELPVRVNDPIPLKLELGVFKSVDYYENKCPQQVVIIEQSTVHEAGHDVNGIAELSTFAESFVIAAEDRFSVTWVANLKSSYRECVAAGHIIKVDDNVNEQPSHLSIRFDRGEFYLTLDMSHIRDLNDLTPSITKKDVVGDNPVWSWSGTH